MDVIKNFQSWERVVEENPSKFCYVNFLTNFKIEDEILTSRWKWNLFFSSLDPQKAHLRLLPNVDTYQIWTSYLQFGGEIWKSSSKNHITELYEGTLKLKSENFQKAHLQLLLHLHIKFQILSSIWKDDRRKIVLFRGKKNPHISFPN